MTRKTRAYFRQPKLEEAIYKITMLSMVIILTGISFILLIKAI